MQNTYTIGDPVNWDMGSQVIYGFVEEDCPKGTPRLKQIKVSDQLRTIWRVPLENLRPTE